MVLMVFLGKTPSPVMAKRGTPLAIRGVMRV